MLKRNASTSLQELDVEIKRLDCIAYTDLPEGHPHRMIVDTFNNTLGNSYYQCHLIAITTSNLEDDVRTGNECLQIQPKMGSFARTYDKFMRKTIILI